MINRKSTFLRGFLLTVMLLSFMLLTLISCDLDTPSDPSWTNPLDARNPDTKGDPYKLCAEIANGGIRLTWNTVEISQLTGYNVYCSVNDSGFVELASVTDTSHTDTTIRNGHHYEYYVVAHSATAEAETSNVASAAINSDPVIFVEGENDTHTPTRNVTLTILAHGAERMMLSNNANFDSSEWETYTTTKNWQLSTRDGTKTVYVKVVYTGDDTSDVISDEIEPTPLNPSVTIEDDSTYTPTRLIKLTIDALGATQMQVSNQPLYSDEVWLDFTNTMDWDLTTGEGTKFVYLNVRNDFLIETETSDQIEPQPLTPSIAIEHDSTHTLTRHVELAINATGATEIQLSNTPFTGSEQWQPFSENMVWELATGSGIKTVYLKVRNDFLIEAEANDQIEPQALTPSISINSDSTYINHRDITLSLPTTGALWMKLCDTLDSAGVDWQDYTNRLNWSLTAGDGWKHVYAWFRNDFFISNMVSDSIGLDTHASIASFNWSSTGSGGLVPDDRVTFTMQTTDDEFGAETGGRAVVTVEGWSGIELVDQANGSYTGSYAITTETPEVSNARAIVSFIDRTGNESFFEANQCLTYHIPAGTERTFSLGNSDESIVMCWIPAGSFMMGRQDGEQDSEDEESPRHLVTFSKGFWMGKYEVTQGQWEAVMGNNPAHDYGVGVDYPVYYVSWDDIQEFESALDNTFRLPSEAEWEYACRAGTTTRFYWGDDGNYSEIGNYAVYNSNDPGGTANVGTKRPNAWGLYDMSGNVYEWCEDWYQSDYTNAPNDGSAWVSPSGSCRVFRGGGWGYIARVCRSAFRGANPPSARVYLLGFRLARDAD